MFKREDFIMIFRQTLPGFLTLAAILGAQTAQAEVTPQQVWDVWKDQLVIYGEGGASIGSEVMSGDTLTVSDVVLRMSDNVGQLTATLAPITLQDRGDGSVLVSMGRGFPIVYTEETVINDPTTMALSVMHDGMTVIVDGDVDAMTYAVDAPIYRIQFDSIAGKAADELEVEQAFVEFRDVQGNYAMRADDLQNLTTALTIGGIVAAVSADDPRGTNRMTANFSLDGFDMQAVMALPKDLETMAPMNIPYDQIAVTAGYEIGQIAADADFDLEGQAGTGAFGIASLQTDIALDATRLDYQTDMTDLRAEVFMPGALPVPVEVSLATYGFGVGVPLTKSDTPLPFAVNFGLVDLILNEGLWIMVDPQRVFPRDPITVALDLAGTITPFFDFLDPKQSQAITMSQVPGEINSVTLNDLRIAGAGALITGNGDVTFDNTDMQTFPGVPRPEGVLELAVNGANSVIDRLIQMGILSPDDAMGGRMMLGLMAVSVGDDMLTSRIEINSQGHVLANGQRLR